jgi:hypothetical protein
MNLRNVVLHGFIAEHEFRKEYVCKLFVFFLTSRVLYWLCYLSISFQITYKVGWMSMLHLQVIESTNYTVLWISWNRKFLCVCLSLNSYLFAFYSALKPRYREFSSARYCISCGWINLCVTENRRAMEIRYWGISYFTLSLFLRFTLSCIFRISTTLLWCYYFRYLSMQFECYTWRSTIFLIAEWLPVLKCFPLFRILITNIVEADTLYTTLDILLHPDLVREHLLEKIEIQTELPKKYFLFPVSVLFVLNF